MDQINLVELRQEINKIDAKLLELLEKRFSISSEIGRYKLVNGLAVEDKKREEEIIANRISSSELDEEFIKNLFELIFAESKKIQMEIK